MSNVIEDRVVEMKFDNSNFEKNVATSMSTLDRLKRSLDFSKSGDSFKELQKAADDVSFDGISESLMAIQDRFSTMGIVGMTIIQNLTSAAFSAITSVGSKFFGMITSGGINRAMNIEKAKFQLEGLGIAYKDVYDEIDYAVTNTSFSLDAAAQAAAQLSSAGLDYDKVIFTHEKDQKEITEMGMALRAVSGVAAQTMSDYSMVARYFQDVANAGKVTGATLTYMTQVLNLPVKQDLAQGLKAIADGSYEATEEIKATAQRLTHGVELSVEEVEKLCSDSQISFDMFSTIMFNKYADHAVEANKTLTGVIDNIKSAFARIGAEFVSPLVAIDGALVHMLDAFRKKVNEFKKYIVPFAKLTTDSINLVVGYMTTSFDKADLRWVEPFFTGLGNIVKGVTHDLIWIGKAFSNVFPKTLPTKLKDFADRFKEFGEKFREAQYNVRNSEGLIKGFESFFKMIKSFGNVFKIFTVPFKGFIEGFKNFIGLNTDINLSITSLFDNITNLLNGSEKLKRIAEDVEWFGYSVGQSFAQLINGIVKSIQSFKDDGLRGFLDTFITKVISRLGYVITAFIAVITGEDVDVIDTYWENIYGGIRDFVLKLYDICSEGITNVSEFIEKLKENFGSFSVDTSGFHDFVESIKGDFDPLQGILNFVSQAIDVFLNFIRSAIPFALSVGKGIITAIKGIFSGLGKILTGTDLDKSLETALGSAFLYNLKNVFIQINKLIGNVNPVQGVSNVLTNLGDAFNAFRKQTDAGVFMSVAGSILILAIAMNIISTIDPKRLSDSTLVIVGLVAELATMAKILSGTKSGSITSGTGALIAMAIAVSILAGAIRKISTVDPERLLPSVIAIGALVLEMQFVAMMLSSTKSKSMIKGASGLIAMAIAIKILASAAKDFADIGDWEDLGKAGAAIGALLVALAAFIKFTSSKETSGILGSNSKKISADKMISIGLGLIALAGALKIMASAAKDFSGMSWEELGKAGAALTVLMAEMAAFTKLTADSAKMVSIGVGMIALAAAMKIFASAAGDFSQLNWEQLGKAGAALMAIVAAAVILSKLTSSSFGGFWSETNGIVKSKGPQNLITLGVGLIAFGAAMKIFASAAEDFGYLDWGDLAKAGASLGALMVGLSLFSHFTGGDNLLKLSGAMVVFSAALLLLVPAVIAISNIGLGGLILTLGAIAGMIFILGKAAKMTESFQDSMIKLSKALLLFGAALAVLGLGLTLLSGGVVAAVGVIPAIVILIKETILAVIHTISEAVPLIVETFFKIVDEILNSLEERIPSIVDSLISIVIKIFDVLTTRVPELIISIKAFLNAVTDAMGAEIGNISPEALIAFAGGLALFMIALAEAAKIAQKSLLGVAAIMAVLLEVSLMFLILSAIDTETLKVISLGLSGALLALSVSMAIISKIPIAGAAKGVAGLAIVIAGITAILVALGALSKIEGFNWIIGEGTKVLGQIGTAIGQFVGNIISGFAEGLTSQLPQIGSNLSAFMINATPFFTGAKLINQDAMDGVLKLVDVILALTKANVLDGITSWLTGGTSFTKFGQELSEFAPYFASYYNTIKDVKPDVIQASANAALALAEMASTLPKEGGAIEWFTGKDSISDFAKQLEPFGQAMVRYSKSVADLDVDVVNKSVSAAQAISELANNLPNSGGVAGWFAGNNDMDTFGEQLCIFGKKLAAYSIYVANVDPSVIEKSVAAGKAISELANNLPNSGGMISWFTGDNDMGTFGAQLTAFGYALSEYSDIVSGDGINDDVIQKSVDAATALSALAEGLPDSGGIVGWFFGDNDLSQFGTQLISFGSAMSEFSSSLSGVELSNISIVVEGCTSLVDLASKLQKMDTSVLKDFGKDASSFAKNLGKAGTSGVTELANSFINSESIISPAITIMTDLIMKLLDATKNKYKDKGEELIRAFADGMIEGQSRIIYALNRITANIFSTLNTNISSSKFVEYGSMISKGLAEGMNSALADVEKAANKMVEIADKATRTKALIKSPSRLFREEGRYIPQGFALGIQDDSYLAGEASEEMITKAYAIMQTAISSISDSIDNEMDLDPVITPVVDLSNVTTMANSINDLFNRSVLIGNLKAKSIGIDTSANPNLQNGQSIGGSNVIFNQYNTSPRALSRYDIYRDTRNMLSQYKSAMG